MKTERNCTILVREQLGTDTVRLLLSVGDMVRTSLRGPGQFVHVKCGDAQVLRRPISVSAWNMSPDGDTLTLVFEVRGKGTAWLAAREPEETLDILGLLGNGYSITPETRCLLVGGGIGVPPMLGCARYTEGRSTAILGFRTAERAILTRDFAGACEKVLLASDDGTLGYHGFVDALVRKELVENPGKYDTVLACGPGPMLRNVAAAAEAAGVPCQVSMEQRMGCGVGACLVCVCDMKDGTRKHVCKDGPVFDAREVDWNA